MKFFNWLKASTDIHFGLPSIMTKLIILLIGVAGAILLNTFFIVPMENKLEKRIMRYPTQWSELSQLIKLQKLNESNEFIPFLNQKEFEVVRTKLNSLGITPNIFRLSNSNEPRIEVQINDVDFSTWLQFSEDLRVKYHLYTENATIQKGNEAGTVQISTTMVQKR